MNTTFVEQVLGMRVVSPENDQGMYVPAAPCEMETIRLGIHVRGDPLQFISHLREVAGAVAPEMVISDTMPLDDVFEGDWYLILAMSLGAALLMGVLLTLAASGIYAILSFAVSERTTEIGIRAALGAGRRDVAVAVARRAVVQVVVGVTIGMPLAAFFVVGDDGSRLDGAGRTLAVGLAVLAVVVLAGLHGPDPSRAAYRPERGAEGRWVTGGASSEVRGRAGSAGAPLHGHVASARPGGAGRVGLPLVPHGRR